MGRTVFAYLTRRVESWPGWLPLRRRFWSMKRVSRRSSWEWRGKTSQKRLPPGDRPPVQVGLGARGKSVKYYVTVEGQVYEISIDHPDRISVDGIEIPVDMRPVGGGQL